MKTLTISMMMALAIANGVNPSSIKDVSFYSDTMAIVDIDARTDLVTVMDFNGVEFQFEGIEDYYIGDLVAVTMCDNGTDDFIYDDIIIDTKYSGWTNEWGFDTATRQPLVRF